MNHVRTDNLSDGRARYQRERVVGLCAAHGWRLVAMRKTRTGNYQVDLERKRDKHRERITTTAAVERIYALVQGRIEEVDR